MKTTFVVKKQSIYEFIYKILFLIYIFIKLNMFGQNIIYYGADIVMLFIAALDYLLHYKRRTRYDYFFIVLFGAFLLFCIDSRSWALNKQYANEVILIMIMLLVSDIVFLEYVSSYKRWLDFVNLFVISCLLHGLYAIVTTPLNKFGTNEFGLATGFYFNNIAQVMAFGCMAALYLFNLKRNYFWIFAIAIMSLIIAVTGSRKGFFMVLFSITIFVFASRQNSLSRLKKIIFFFLIILLGYNVIMSNDFLYQQIGSRLTTVFAFLGDSRVQGDFSTNERLYFLANGISLFKSHPWRGVGVNNFKAYVVGYMNTRRAYSHNNYIELLSDVGIIGFALYYCNYIRLVVKAFKKYFKNGRNNIDLFVVAMLSMLMILEYGNVTYYFIQYHLVLVIVCSYLYVSNISESIPRKGSINEEKQTNRRIKRLNNYPYRHLPYLL